jgi:hypothetical protein
MKTVTDYTLITGFSAFELESQIKAWVNNGWQLHSGLKIRQRDGQLYQAMVKYREVRSPETD